VTLRRWFLSYHSPDQALARALKDAIESREPEDQVFFAAERLRTGFWSLSLANAIDQADVFVLLVGASIGRWQLLEYCAALDRKVSAPGFRLVVVIQEGQLAPGLPFLRQLHWIVTSDPTSSLHLTQIMEAADSDDVQAEKRWRYVAPYRGLVAMEESDSDYFFGRSNETAKVLDVLAGASDRIPVLLGNSGVGKSSIARAGVMAALKRQAWPENVLSRPWPAAFAESRRWCFLVFKPDDDPLRAIVEAFVDTWQYDAADPKRTSIVKGWVSNLTDGTADLRGLLKATTDRYDELGYEGPPAYFLYIDQGEELYVEPAKDPARLNKRISSRRLSAILAEGVSDPRLFILISLRSDFLGEMQKDAHLHGVHTPIDVSPLREAELLEVVKRPAELLSASFEPENLAAAIAKRTAEDAAGDAGSLPLLSYTLDDMWQRMVKENDEGVLGLGASTFEPQVVLVDRANKFLADHQTSEDALRRILTGRLATVRKGERVTRRRALRTEFSDEHWQLVSKLADHPNRLLVVGTGAGKEVFAEVAHETIFERWEKLKNWIESEQSFLLWRTGLEAAQEAWATIEDETNRRKSLLTGAPLAESEQWLEARREDLRKIDREFIEDSLARDRAVRSRERRGRAFLVASLIAIIVGLVGWMNQSNIAQEYQWWTVTRPYRIAHFDNHALPTSVERALKPLDAFRECDSGCPEMVVVPLPRGGSFAMGSVDTGRRSNEGPPQEISLVRLFAVSKFEATFSDWDACVEAGYCPHDERATDAGVGRGRMPAFHVSWNDAKLYVAWLSRMTGKPYRLLTESEWEYVARGNSLFAYSWGARIRDNGEAMAVCNGCGSNVDAKRPAEVGSFFANAFGVFDMHGNVWEWVEDCFSDDISQVPRDGSARVEKACSLRAIRGGGWDVQPKDVRSTLRHGISPVNRSDNLGFRVARTLSQ
jgi:formylglycine-generating enzyme required for sulfatase activity